MKRLLLILLLALALVSAGVAGAATAVHWPASCSKMACVDTHLNDVHATAQRALTRAMTPGPAGPQGPKGDTGPGVQATVIAKVGGNTACGVTDDETGNITDTGTVMNPGTNTTYCRFAFKNPNLYGCVVMVQADDPAATAESFIGDQEQPADHFDVHEYQPGIGYIVPRNFQMLVVCPTV